MLKKIYLIDTDSRLIDAWESQFHSYAGVDVIACDYFDIPADCMVSPANSFGYMDGGLDRVITYELGVSIQENVQKKIVADYHGELPVGPAVIIETGAEKWPYLIAAPTMRVPEDVSDTINAYIAFRAILLLIAKFNADNPKRSINTLVCSGLATGIGNLNPKQCALQMKRAYDSCLDHARILSPSEIYASHDALCFDNKKVKINRMFNAKRGLGI